MVSCFVKHESEEDPMTLSLKIRSRDSARMLRLKFWNYIILVAWANIKSLSPGAYLMSFSHFLNVSISNRTKFLWL